MTQETNDDLKQQLSCTQALVNEKDAELEHARQTIAQQSSELARFADNLLDSMRAEGDLNEEVQTLHEELKQLRLAEQERKAAYHMAYAQAFRDILSKGNPRGPLAEAQQFVEQHAGTPEATERAREALLRVLDARAANAAKQLKVLEEQNSSHAVWETERKWWSGEPELIERLPPAEKQGLAALRVAIPAFAMLLDTVRQARDAEGLAIRAAKASLASEVAPALLVTSFLAAIEARYPADTAEHYVGSVRKVIEAYQPRVNVAMREQMHRQIEARANARRAQEAHERLSQERLQQEQIEREARDAAASTQTESAWLDDEAPGHATSITGAIGYGHDQAPSPEPFALPEAPQPEFDDYDYDYDYHSSVNPASGLPMMDAVFDVHLNVYGTNDTFGM